MVTTIVVGTDLGTHDTTHDALPSSLMDSTTSPKVKTSKEKGVGARSLACNILGVRGMLKLWDGD